LSFHLLSKNVNIKIYKTIILPVVLFGCEIWLVPIKEEHALMVFENRVLWRIFGRNRNEVTGGWRKLRDEEHHNLYCSYSSLNIISMIKSRRMRWVGHVAHMGEMRMHKKFWLRNLKGGDHSEDISIGGCIILKWMLGK
jgi:hypothetical protein